MTSTTMVTFEEVLAAAGRRFAALAPETAGYMALAVGDAMARVPMRVHDRAVAITTEGSVIVQRKGGLVAPSEAALVLRDMLARMLAVSSGSMPGLSAAARPRVESDVGDVVAQLEGALIPVNREAARRAIARIARETMRAREAGQIRAVRQRNRGGSARVRADISEEFATERPAPAVAVRAPTARRARSALSRAASARGKAIAEPVEALARALEARSPGGGSPVMNAHDRTVLDTVFVASDDELEFDDRAPVRAEEQGLVDCDDIVGPCEPTPTVLGLGTEFRVREGRMAPAQRPSATAANTSNYDDGTESKATSSSAVDHLGPTRSAVSTLDALDALVTPDPIDGGGPLTPSGHSTVDDLIRQFHVSGEGDERRVAFTLKAFAGVDATAIPPRAKVVPKAASPVRDEERVAPIEVSEQVFVAPKKAKSYRSGRVVGAVVVMLGVVAAVATWHFRPEVVHEGVRVLRSAVIEPARR